jgi:hypothetical protein
MEQVVMFLNVSSAPDLSFHNQYEGFHKNGIILEKPLRTVSGSMPVIH